MGRHGEQISAPQTCHRRGLGAEPPAAGGYGSLGAKHPAAGRVFVSFWEKMAILMPFGRTKFLRFESQLKKTLLLLQVKSKTRLKSFILGLNFVTWPG